MERMRIYFKIMIKQITANLLDFPKGITHIAHSCNTLGKVWGAGLAKQIKNRYPSAFITEITTFGGSMNQLGNIFPTKLKDEKYIWNMYTQSFVSREVRAVNYESLYVCLEKLKVKLESGQFGEKPVLGLPFGLSCGLAGGSWLIVSAMIKELFHDSKISVNIVKLPEIKKE